MSKDLDNKYFIFLNKYEIIFSCLNNENKITFTKKHILTNSPNNLFEELENFFIDNLFEIEKSLQDFIKNIYIIFGAENNLSAHLSIKHKLITEKINENKINELLSSLKYQFIRYNNDQEVVHMTISKFLIGGEKKALSLNREASGNLILEVKFECLKIQTINIIKKICSNYQISVVKIILLNHLKEFFQNPETDFFLAANNFISGNNKDEVVSIKKKTNKTSFFEKFFNIFR